MELSEGLERIAAAPAGPQVGAFFDLDGTLVAGYTATAFLVDQVRQREIPVRDFVRTVASALEGEHLGGKATAGVERGLATMAGLGEDTLYGLGERLFAQKIARTVRSDARELVRAHQRMGHTVVVTSAATPYQIAPVANALGIDHIVCTQMEVVDGVLTGRVEGDILYGPPKAAGMRAFARKFKIDLKESFAYGNGAEDVAFLSGVGHPTALNPHPGLRGAAESLGWPVIMLRDPAASNLTAVARTALAYAGLNLGGAAGAAWGAATRDRQRGINAGVALACDATLRLAGVSVRTTGAEHLETRPAIFVANHQSSLDPIVAGALLREEFTAIAKKEARFDPRALITSVVLNPSYIDRSDPKQARATLDALVERVRGGMSLLIFPEGTRSPTLGQFKKGAFHLAHQAQVPVVPIVLRNTGELMPRNSQVIRPGVVDVRVLAPVYGWSSERLPDMMADLHNAFAATLADWKASDA